MGWDRTERPESQPRRARKKEPQALSATEEWELEQRRAEWAERRNPESLDRGNRMREDWEEEQRRAADDRAIEAMREKERQRRAANQSPSATEPSKPPEGIPLEMTRRKDSNNPFNLGDPPRESARRIGRTRWRGGNNSSNSWSSPLGTAKSRSGTRIATGPLAAKVSRNGWREPQAALGRSETTGTEAVATTRRANRLCARTRSTSSLR